MQKAILGVLAILAVAGWAAAYVFFTESGDLERRLKTVGAERAKLAEALEAAQEDLKSQVDSTGRLDEIQQQLSTAEQRASDLQDQVRSKQEEVVRTDKAIENGKVELNSLTRQLSERTTALRSLEQEIQSAETQIGRLKAELANLQRTAERSPAAAATPSAGDAPAAATAGSEARAAIESPPTQKQIQQMNPQERAESRFQILDKNGDGSIDEFEFRLNSIRLLGAIDTNNDGVITPDETLLTPEKFSVFDLDGDGQISSLEFLEAFRIIDRDGKGSISFEEYMAFLRDAAK
jgi:hypothetical protein